MDFRAEPGSRIGILGGTFDPVHNGHLVLAAAARDGFALDLVVFIPAAQPPHKLGEPVSSFAHRAAMLELALTGRPAMVVSRMEQQRLGPSFSIDTLRELRRNLPAACPLFFIIGSDAFAEITTWKNYQELFRYADFLVAERPDLAPGRLAGLLNDLPGFLPPAAGSPSHSSPPDLRPWRHRQGGLIYPCPVDAVPVSATNIRSRVRRGESVADSVPAPVAAYIRQNRLYR
ncbi:MAG TPA: nicotinate (nicotinamide) nucleotide adenylyltransferase [Desulfurivibrio alkaliphilus]|uniref:Probable nicotinate-nucleotide adenylyltransferase n=1 Tax=Desulfurivibrio alkaliphilus TaxID=427923 RepID=A0A7C2THZ9_9BACT|nr:nicotinate (nicotinamide) nucleotide adenylyltransferase [Desulfurivibrio alkaliphilus]